MSKSHQNKHRENRIMLAVDCPACGAVRGQPCGWNAARNCPVVCSERKLAWQEQRRGMDPT